VPVQITCETRAGRPYVASLAGDARRLLRECGFKTAELSLLITDDARIRALNHEFRHKDRATDVLSFALSEQPPEGGVTNGAAPQLLGDIVISLDTAERQARTAGIAVAERLRALLIHGLLHLLGYDHERSRNDARIMFRRERELRAVLDKPGRAGRPFPPP